MTRSDPDRLPTDDDALVQATDVLADSWLTMDPELKERLLTDYGAQDQASYQPPD